MALTQASRAETGRSQRIAFSASIILNLFFVALIGGYLLQPNFMATQTGGPVGRTISLVESQLDPADVAIFRAVVQRDKSRNAEAERALTSSRDALEDDLASEPFNQARAKIAVTNTREAFDRLVDSFSATVIDALGQLSPAGRKKLVELRRKRLGALGSPTSP